MSFGEVMVKKLLKSSLKSYFLLLRKIFEIWKLGKYKSDINETYMIYVLP